MATVNQKILNSLYLYNQEKDTQLAETYVGKVQGKQLSTEDFTTAEKTKLGELGNYFAEATYISADTLGATISNFSLKSGVRVALKAPANRMRTGLKIKINNLAAIDVYYNSVPMSGVYIYPGQTYEFIFDGSVFRHIGMLDISPQIPDLIRGGYVFGNPTFTPKNAAFGRSALYFDRRSFITFTNPPNVTDNDFTVEGWFYLLEDDNVDGCIFMGLYLGSNSFNNAYLRLNKTNSCAYFTFTWRGESFELADDIPLNRLCHIAMVYKKSANSMTCFVNGVKKNTAIPQHEISQADYFFATLGGYLTGAGDLIVYNTSISPNYVRLSQCYADCFRIYRQALYNENFTPPTEIPTHSDLNNAVYLYAR